MSKVSQREIIRSIYFTSLKLPKEVQEQINMKFLEEKALGPGAQLTPSLLEESIEIVRKKGFWKDVPDAAKYIRNKRDGECCRCGTTKEHPDPLSCPYEP